MASIGAIEVNSRATLEWSVQLWKKFIMDDRPYLFFRLMERVDSFRLDNFAIGCFRTVAPIGFGRSTVGYKYHNERWL